MRIDGTNSSAARAMLAACIIVLGMVARSDAQGLMCMQVGRCADINASGTVSASDALSVLREAVGLETDMACGCTGDAAAEVEFLVESPIVGTGASLQLTAHFTHIDDQSPAWKVNSDPAVGEVTTGGLYTAGAVAGEDQVEVASLVNPQVRRTQTIRVLGSEKQVPFWGNANGYGVDNEGTPPQFVVLEPVTVSSITTYHWNYSYGTDEAGTIALHRIGDGVTFGPWQATGTAGLNRYWVVDISGFELPAGTYEVIDSDPYTWAQNSATGGAGMAWIYRWVLE